MTPKAFCKLHRLSAGAFARRLKISHTFAWRVLTGKRKVSADLAKDIERRTKGAISRHDLRPDLFGRKPRELQVAHPTESIAKLAMASQPEQTAPAVQAAEPAVK